MGDDPSVQVSLVAFLSRITAPDIVFIQFVLLKVIAHFLNGQREGSRRSPFELISVSNPVTAVRAESASEYWQTVPITLFR